MRIKNIFRRKKYVKGGVSLKEVMESVKHDKTCDECDRLEECKKNGGVQEITTPSDAVKHYLAGYKCLKNPYAMADMAYKEYKGHYLEFQSVFSEMLSEGMNWKQLESICDEYHKAHAMLMESLEKLFGG